MSFIHNSPFTIYNSLRKFYNKLKRRWYPKLTEEKFKQIITQDLGVKSGSVVYIHSAVNKLNLAFPFYRIIPILLEIVGEEGTLVFPCWHFDGRAEEYLKKNEVFDVKKTPTVMGIIPELARRYKNAYRSLHPTNSVVAIGKYASEITGDHINSILPCDEHSPFYKIMNPDNHRDAIIIGLGVSTYNLSFVHCVEDVMQETHEKSSRHEFPVKTRMDEIFDAPVRDQNGEIKIVKTKVAHPQIKYRNIEKYMREYIPKTICRDIKINGVKYFTANSGKLFKKMELLAEKGITIYTSKAAIKNQVKVAG